MTKVKATPKPELKSKLAALEEANATLAESLAKLEASVAGAALWSAALEDALRPFVAHFTILELINTLQANPPYQDEWLVTNCEAMGIRSALTVGNFKQASVLLRTRKAPEKPVAVATEAEVAPEV